MRALEGLQDEESARYSAELLPLADRSLVPYKRHMATTERVQEILRRAASKQEHDEVRRSLLRLANDLPEGITTREFVELALSIAPVRSDWKEAYLRATSTCQRLLWLDEGGLRSA